MMNDLIVGSHVLNFQLGIGYVTEVFEDEVTVAFLFTAPPLIMKKSALTEAKVSFDLQKEIHRLAAGFVPLSYEQNSTPNQDLDLKMTDKILLNLREWPCRSVKNDKFKNLKEDALYVAICAGPKKVWSYVPIYNDDDEIVFSADEDCVKYTKNQWLNLKKLRILDNVTLY